MNRSVVELHFADGSIINAFRSFKHRETFSDPIGSLEMELAPIASKIKDYREKLKKGELVSLLVDGKPQAGLYIEAVTTTISPDDGIVINLDAVSPLKLLYEGSVSEAASKVLQADGPLIDLISAVVDPFGIGEVQVENDIASIKSKTGKATGAKATKAGKLKFKQAQVAPGGEMAYAFLARILTRVGVMLRMDAALGLIYVTAPHYDGEPLYTITCGPLDQVVPGDRAFGQLREVDSNAGQWSFAEVTGVAFDDAEATSAGVPKARTLSTDINAARPPFRAGAATSYKPKFLKDAECRDTQMAGSVGKLVLGLSAEKAYAISLRVHGLVSREGVPWTVDTLCRLHVPQLGIDETMWISERTFCVNADESQYTELTLIPPGNFVIGDTP